MSGALQDPAARKQAIAGVFDRSADSYDQVGDFFTPMGHDLVALAALGRGERVLDLGCGRGAVLFAAAAAVGPSGSVHGIDLAPRMVSFTEQELRARGLTNVTVAVGDAEDPGFPDRSFDAVLAALVLFFLPDAPAALARYARLLAPGGRLGFTTFATNDPTFEAAMGALTSFVPGGLAPRGDRQGPLGSPEGIAGLLADAGFGVPTIAERTYETRFRDPEEWVAWAWSHGGRATLERVPAERRDDAEAAAMAAFRAARTDEGDYVIRTTIRFTLAHPR